MFKKLTLSIIASLVLFFNLLVPYAHAQGANPTYQGPWYFQGPVQWYTKVYDTSNPQEIFGERYTNAQVQWVIYSLFSIMITMFTGPEIPMCILTGDITGPCTDVFKKIYGVADSGNGQYYAEGDNNQNLLSAIFQPKPLSGVSYVTEKVTQLHIVPEVKAQTGFGYGALGFIQTMWGATRDIMYAFMILIIIAIAFMIMFRTKISPQAVITVQSALPKVIITLILITFSYAIAGFLIDLMYVSIGLISLLLSQSGIFICGGNGNPPGCASFGQPIPAAVIFNGMINGGNGLGAFGDFFTYWIHFTIALIGIILTPDISSNPLSDLWFSQVIGTGLVSSIIGMLIFAIVTVFLLIVTFKVMWMLIKTFINIILYVIAGPFIIGFGAVSASAGGFGSWLRGLISNLLVYPVFALLFAVAEIFLGAAYFTGGVPTFLGAGVGTSIQIFHVNPDFFNVSPVWSPPLTVGTGTSAVRFLWLFVSVGVIAITPKVVELIQSMMARKPFAYGSAIGEATTAPMYGMGQSYVSRIEGGAKTITGTPTLRQKSEGLVAKGIKFAAGGKIK